MVASCRSPRARSRRRTTVGIDQRPVMPIEDQPAQRRHALDSDPVAIRQFGDFCDAEPAGSTGAGDEVQHREHQDGQRHDTRCPALEPADCFSRHVELRHDAFPLNLFAHRCANAIRHPLAASPAREDQRREQRADTSAWSANPGSIAPASASASKPFALPTSAEPGHHHAEENQGRPTIALVDHQLAAKSRRLTRKTSSS